MSNMAMDSQKIKTEELLNQIHDTFKNESVMDFSFFRNIYLKKWLQDKENKSLKVWDACAKNGIQSSFVSALLTKSLEERPFKILATDPIVKNILQAKNGVYQESQLKPFLNQSNIEEFFVHGKNEVQGWIKFTSQTQDHINFQQHDLGSYLYLNEEIFDLILAQDFEGYSLTEESSEIILNKIHRSLKKSGLFMTDAALKLTGFERYFRLVAPGVFKKI